MSRQYCELCGQPIEAVDFYLEMKGGTICPSCVPLVRSVQSAERQKSDAGTMPWPWDALAGDTTPRLFL